MKIYVATCVRLLLSPNRFLRYLRIFQCILLENFIVYSGFGISFDGVCCFMFIASHFRQILRVTFLYLLLILSTFSLGLTRFFRSFFFFSLTLLLFLSPPSCKFCAFVLYFSVRNFITKCDILLLT